MHPRVRREKLQHTHAGYDRRVIFFKLRGLQYAMQPLFYIRRSAKIRYRYM
jgi:hypothetical protein